MSFAATVTGRTYPAAEPYVVERQKIREFAAAIGATNPVYRDRNAAQALGHPDAIAPPTFPGVLALANLGQLAGDSDFHRLDWARALHMGQRFAYHRPVRVGDRLVCRMTVESVAWRGGTSRVTTRCDIQTVEAEAVVQVWSTLMVPDRA
jgi:acyl dehydratase